MANWKDGVDPGVFHLNHRIEDKVLLLEEISALNPSGGRILLQKGSQYRAGMKGGFIFCHLGGNKYNEAAITPADFTKIQIVSNMTIV